MTLGFPDSIIEPPSLRLSFTLPDPNMISRRTLLFALLCMLAPLIWAERAGAETEKSARRGDHWSFRSPGRPELPPCDATRTARGAIDAFVLARLESEGLKASPEADRSTLIRRLSLDLTGLPPGPGEVRTSRPTPMSVLWTDFSPHRTLASAGDATGWILPAMPIPTVTRSTDRGPGPGAGATG